MKRDNWVGFLPFYLLVVILTIGISYGGAKTLTVLKENAGVSREHTVIIDAGHGGIDGGATSCTGVLESAVNLEIALRLDDLMHFLGYKTVMIRTTDRSVYTSGTTIAAQKVSDLRERVRIVNEAPGGVLISIHQNTFSDSRYGGAQVFYSENENSKLLATALQKKWVSVLNPDSRRTAKKGEGIYLLQHISQVGVLVECGFLSNPKEEAMLRSADYQKKMCCVIAATVSGFLTERD